MEPIFFDAPAELRAWLGGNHATAGELLVGLWKRGSGRPGITWAELVDEALCHGWIDGVRRSIDAESYSIRLTPRKAGSRWSAVNVRRAEELIAAGRMEPAGLAAYERRIASAYSHERAEEAELRPGEERRFRENRAAWRFWESQPPGYRRTALHLVVSAKREETRQRRLAALIADSAAGLRLKQLR